MLSVIVCTYNRDRYLNDCFESLKNQTYNKQFFEIILINNNSTDNTEKISKQFQAKNPDLNFRYYIEKKQGLSNARNKGIEVAKGEYIAFVDDDAIADKNYIINLAKTFEEQIEYTAIGGKVIPIYPNNKKPVWMSKYIQRMVSEVDYGNIAGEFYKRKYPVGCNMAFHKSFFDKHGGFNADLTLRSDDKFIFSKLRKLKKKTFYAPDVIVHHNIESYRLEPDFIKKLSILNGKTERIRLQSEPLIYTIIKPFEYLFKIIAAILIGISFIFKGQYIKAKYLVMIMWLSLIGFIKK
ncbi:MAG: glycosyltransferase family 2 protein [Bacteroidales bacterium]|nr:glycosyltransferase family 2 protein [Bacteroidales bacterium]